MRRELLAACSALALASAGLAQSTPSVTVRGTVIDAASSLPLAGAQLTLTGLTPSVFPGAGPSPVLPGSRLAVTDSAGGYQINGVPAGEYRLFVRRLGYQPALVDLDATQSANEARLSFGLVVVPVRLEAIRIDANRVNAFGRLALGDDSTAVNAPAVALARQAKYLGTDVRELTMSTAIEAGGSGETDVLRALARLPGVSAMDNRSTEIWVRGSRWDQVRISYDGLPIFNPIHASGATSIAGEAIGAAFFHPGVRPVSLLAQGASLLDIRSRAATDTTHPWMLDATTRGISMSHEHARPGHAGIAFSVRRNTGTVIDLPYFLRDAGSDASYTDIAARYDRVLGQGKALEVSLLRTRDNASFIPQQGQQAVDVLPVFSGSTLGRVTMTTDAGRFRLSQTVGMSAYDASDVSVEYPLGVVDTALMRFYPFYRVAGGYYSKQSSVSYFTYRGDIEPREDSVGKRWNAGYQFFRYHTSSFGLAHALSWSAVDRTHVNLRGTRQFGALWMERRWSPASALTVNTGLRVETSLDELGVRAAPSAQARYRLNGTTSLSIGAARTFQDAQQLPYTNSGSVTDRGFWLLSGSAIPVLRADQASAGLERWFGESILFDANVFARRLTDVAVRPLPAGDSVARPLSLASEVRATGAEIGLRKLAGRVTGSVGYTWGHATQRIGESTFTAAGDRTHAVDGTLMVRAGKNRFGTAYTFMTGAPYTQMFIGRGIYVAPDSVHWTSLSRSGTRNAHRLSNFSSLDLFAERSLRIGGKSSTAFLGIQNALNGRNQSSAWAAPDGVNLTGNPNVDSSGNMLLPTTGRRYTFGFRVVF